MTPEERKLRDELRLMRLELMEVRKARDYLREERGKIHEELSRAGMRTHNFKDDDPPNVEWSALDRVRMLCAAYAKENRDDP